MPERATRRILRQQLADINPQEIKQQRAHAFSGPTAQEVSCWGYFAIGKWLRPQRRIKQTHTRIAVYNPLHSNQRKLCARMGCNQMNIIYDQSFDPRPRRLLHYVFL